MSMMAQEPREQTEPELPVQTSWSASRWVFCVTLAFAAHVGLIFAFGNRKPTEPRAVVNAPAIQFSTARTELQALADPTLFALPHAHGFAASSWLRLPKVEFAPFRWSDPPQLMTLPTGKLGNAFLLYALTNALPQLNLATLSLPEQTQLEAPDQPTALRQRSAVRITGAVARRRWLNAPELLRSWSAGDFLTNSIVQVLADADGQVLSAALIPPGSGSKTADQRALEIARSARFSPAPRDGGRLTVGTLIFEWHTTPLMDTNTPPAKP